MPVPELDAIDVTGFFIPRVTSFGDSYSRSPRSVRHPVTGKWVRVLNWVEQANRDGHSGVPATYGVSGATAANGPVFNGVTNSMAQQVQRWVSNGRQLGPKEATVLYFGHNDVEAIEAFPTLADLQRSKNAYGTSAKRLINLGATSGDRRMFLFLIHDWGRNPSKNGDPGLVYRKRTQSWNSFVRFFAKGRPNVVTVDLHTTFNRVFANPSAYGLSNVRTADLDRSATAALYADPDHFGQKGHDIVEQVFLHHAARAWGWNAATQASAEAAARIGRDVDRGIALGVDGLPPERRPGLNAFTVGDAAAVSAEEAQPVDADPTRVGFAQAYRPTDGPTAASASTTRCPPTARWGS
jgi:hypothetical protein